jgi:hypothetical protein
MQGGLDVAQRMDTQVDGVDVGDRSDCVRYQNLAAMPSGGHSRRCVHRRPEIVPVSFVRLTHVQTHTYAKRETGPRRIRELDLCPLRRCYRGRHSAEGRGETIATRRKDVAAFGLDSAAYNSVVNHERL